MSCRASSAFGTLLMLATQASFAQDCPPPPAGDAHGPAELLLAVDTGPGGSESLQSVLHDVSGRFWLEESTLGMWRVPLPEQGRRHYAGRNWHVLDTIPGMGVRFDGCAQALHIDLSAVQRETAYYALRPAPPPVPPMPPSPGAFANFDLQLASERGDTRFDSLTEVGVFGPHGRGMQTFVLGDGRRLRLDSTWFWEFPERLRTLAFGDNISEPGGWGRALRYGGLRWATDFSLQPHFVTFPQPALRGEAALPSTLEVFVDDSLRARQDVQGGAFELQDVPTLTGGGEARIVVRDVLGRETAITQPFYVDASLLRAGLADFAVDVGWQRRGFGVDSADYGSAFAAVTHRFGVSNTLTRELRTELAHDALAAGGSVRWLADPLGVVSATLAWGGGAHAGGALAALGLQRDIAGRYGVGLRSQWTEPEFWQLGLDGRLPPRRSDFARLSHALPGGASLALALVHEDRRGEDDLQLITLSTMLRLGRDWHLGMSASDVDASGRHRSVLATLSRSFGGGLNGSAQAEWTEGHDTRGGVAVQRTMAGPLDWGWRAELQSGAAARQQLRGDWGFSAAQLSAEAVHDDLGTSGRVNARSGLVFLDRQGYSTRPITGSFAVVRAAGIPGVDVYADNRHVARTSASGTALVPELRPYERNHLSIRAEDLPIETNVARLSQSVTPRGRSGVVVSLGEEQVIGMELRLQDEDGKPVPAGAEVRELATGERFPVGSDGRVFIQQTPGIHHLWVQATGWDCIARVEVRETPPSAALPVAVCRREQ